MVSKLLTRFIIEESGQSMVEYAAILAFVALVVAIVFSFKGSLVDSLRNAYSSVTTQLNSISGSS